MREAPSAEALRRFRQPGWANAWLPDEVAVPPEWAEAGFVALGRMQMTGRDGQRSVWDTLVDTAGTRVVSLPVAAPAGPRGGAHVTVMSPLEGGGAVTTVDGSGAPSRLRFFLIEPHHPPSGIHQRWSDDGQPRALLAAHAAQLAHAGPPRAIEGRHEWRRAMRRVQRRTLDVHAALRHATRHQKVVLFGSLIVLLGLWFGWPLLQAQLGPAAPAGPLLGIPWLLQLVMLAFVPTILERVYLVLATRRLARTGPIPEVEPLP